eukprot:958001-Alexandrium_andersonii.AAC.1
MRLRRVGSASAVRMAPASILRAGGAPAVFTAVGLQASGARPPSARVPEEALLEPGGVTVLAERLGGSGGTTSL